MQSSTSTSSSTTDMYVRKAYHAGTWYDNNPIQLEKTIETFLTNVQREKEKTNYLHVPVAPFDVNENNDTTTNILSDTILQQQHQHQHQHYNNNKSSNTLRGIICPHAGFTYSGQTAAYGFYELYNELLLSQRTPTTNNSTKSKIEHILILHPSHHISITNQCYISNANIYETPMGSLTVSDTIRTELLNLNSTCNTNTDRKKVLFNKLTKNIDEQEHGCEMILPFLYYILNKTNTIQQIKVLGIMIGCMNDTTTNTTEYFSSLLQPILNRSNVFTIISTDFCHWGKRFAYTSLPKPITITTPPPPPPPPPKVPKTSFWSFHKEEEQQHKQQDQNQIPIHEQIEQMDKYGMSIIQQIDPNQFSNYLQQTNNTICGRDSILIYLHLISLSSNRSTSNNNHNDNNNNTTTTTDTNTTTTGTTTTTATAPVQIQFIHYTQSSKVTSMNESSVSYASGIMYI